MADPLIEINGVNKNFGDKIVLDDIHLKINNGEFLTLLGASGCGKTTLLRIISGLETTDSGTVILNNRDITHVPPGERHLNMVFQNYALFPHMTVAQNIAFGLECEGASKTKIKAEVAIMLETFQLTALADRKPAQLSGGQQQRVAIARAAIKKPLVLLFDEALSALDHKLRIAMRAELKALQRQLGITFIFVTHDQEEALSMSDRIVVLNKGRIEQIGSPRDIYEEPKSLFVAQFIGLANIFKTKVLAVHPDNRIDVDLTGSVFTLKYKKGTVHVGAYVNVIIRPEDLAVWHRREMEDVGSLLHGRIKEVVYKGSTVDLTILLDNGKEIFATEFFNEDDQKLEYELNEPVLVELKEGWEVTLPDED